MATIVGIAGKTLGEIEHELLQGARFVHFTYTVSIVLMTFRRSSAIYLLHAGEGRLARHWPHSLLTLLLGWWGIPWGPIYTVQSLYTNLTGGSDVTEAVWASLVHDAAAQQPRPQPAAPARPAPQADPEADRAA